MSILNLNDRPASADMPYDFISTFHQQKAAFENNKFPSLNERRRQLKALKEALTDNSDDIIAALSKDFGSRCTEETRLSEISNSVGNIEYASRHLASWMRTRSRGTGIWFLPGENKIAPQPRGVVGIIVPWNYPINIAVSGLASAIAAGNRCIVKMSECTPASENVLRKIISSVFDNDHISIVGGEADAAAAFSALPFDHLMFTGSTRVGRFVMAAAAKNLTPVTLELGGKSPVIVHDQYPIDEFAKRVLWGKTYNAGQTCIAPDYALLPKGSTENFKVWISRHFRNHFPEGISSKDYTSIINTANYDRLTTLVNEAEAEGATIIRMEDPTPAHIASRKFPLTLVINPNLNSRVMKEEIFGPIFPIIEVASTDEAISFVNERERPLALYLFSNSRRLQEQVLESTHAGGVTINDVMMQYLQAAQPFGGVGSSGFGSYHGKEGFTTFSHMKPVFRQRGIGRFTGIKLLYPPYGNIARRLISLMGG
ncbi:aldehyde dehydrogenase family protein [Zhongshania aquimaris]|uniref:Aldehyde dehydrogenase n=1 Tax=Zhongshania aquimaris TaxID=2857107 RepID=A0ABS6VV93_9GAMM|nr:aldehyde dehydrogenase family protein [Zhongshania aquimaris]MBW2942259.1 aldehyde dehydrogenase family protein [Zhongshania aquimaris]